MTVEQVEVKLKALGPLYLEDYTHVQKPLEDFIIEFINKLNLNFKTANCRMGAHRSLGDIYRIVVTYYPDASLQSVLDILNSLWNNKQLKTMFCWNIKKRVYFENKHEHRNDSEEFLNRLSPYTGPQWLSNEYGWMQKDFLKQ